MHAMCGYMYVRHKVVVLRLYRGTCAYAWERLCSGFPCGLLELFRWLLMIRLVAGHLAWTPVDDTANILTYLRMVWVEYMYVLFLNV